MYTCAGGNAGARRDHTGRAARGQLSETQSTAGGVPLHRAGLDGSLSGRTALALLSAAEHRDSASAQSGSACHLPHRMEHHRLGRVAAYRAECRRIHSAGVAAPAEFQKAATLVSDWTLCAGQLLCDRCIPAVSRARPVRQRRSDCPHAGRTAGIQPVRLC